jgi:hypothetical protein
MTFSKTASALIGLLLFSVSTGEAQASIWCPTPIPGVLMKYCYCQSFTGSAAVSTSSRLPPLQLVGVLNSLRQAAKADWASRVQAHQQPRKFLSTKLLYARDIDRDCRVTRKGLGIVCCLHV